MEKVLEREICSGCTACANICPKEAITMKKGIDGFKHPVINQEKCINCGLCKKTCPVLNTKNNNSINKCYAAYCNDDEYTNNSSSGGLFSLIANYVLEENGIIIGAAFIENNKLNHIAISKKEELKKLKGSKYLQSDLKNIFKYIKENIKSTKILFVGTPCQVAGLKSFLNKDYENLITIDLFCHGVPSPKLFEKYVDYLEKKYNDKLIFYNFRDKSTGWDTYSNTAAFKNTNMTELRTKNNYMELFLSDNALRESCYNCNFKLGNKYSDITLGDFWGIKEVYPEIYNKKGVSAVIINTEKGQELFAKVSNKLTYKECSLGDIVERNPSLIKSAKLSNKRKSLFNDLDNIPFDKLTRIYRKRTPLFKKVIIRIKKLLIK